MSTQHTPGQWQHGERFEPGRYTFRYVVAINDGHGEVIAHVNCGFGRGENNAAFIVRACNAHADLLAALREMVANIEQFPYGSREQKRSTMDKARAAIAKATEEKS